MGIAQTAAVITGLAKINLFTIASVVILNESRSGSFIKF